MKRAISFLLTLAMVLGLLSIGVGAADEAELTACGLAGFHDAEHIGYKQAVAITAALGLFSGTADGNFDPLGKVNRAQMAAIVVKMLKGSDFNSDSYKGETNPFPDTADFEGGWAEGYVNACCELGVVSGYPDGTFHPEKEVTAAEALTMLLNALKIDAGAGDWPKTVMAKVEELDFCAGLKTQPEADTVLNREELAAVVNVGVQYKPTGGEALLSSVFGMKKINVGHKYDETTKLCTTCGIPMPSVDPAADNELNILLLGNSLSYYWPDELWGMLNAAGYENVTICNIYYDGCTFAQHLRWLLAGESHYRLCINDATGRHTQEKMDLVSCLAYKQWDIISMQQAAGQMNRAENGEETFRETLAKSMPWLYAYLRGEHPNAKFYWPQIWPVALGRGMVTTVEIQEKVTAGYHNIAKDVCAEYNMTNVPMGDAWALVRHDPVVTEGGTKTLTTRIFKEKPNHDDSVHDGDVGGGQYLNACVWYEVITQKNCKDNTFRPKYVLDGQDLSLSEEKIALLQNAAHTAVAGIYGDDYAK